MTRWSFTLLCCGLLAVLSTGCGTKPASPKTALPTLNRGVIVPEEIRRDDGTLQYVVRRLGMSSGGHSSIKLHEVWFYAADGKTLLKTQNFFIGPNPADVASVIYFHPNGNPKETRQYDHTTGKLTDVSLHDEEGNVVKTVKRTAEEVDLELLPYLQNPGRGTRPVQPTVVALPELSPAQAYRELLEEIEQRVTVTDEWKKEYKEQSPTSYEAATVTIMLAIMDLKNPAVRLISKADAADRQAARWGGYSGVGFTTKSAGLIGSPLVVKNVLADTPAEQAGLKAGDKITAVDAQKFEGWSLAAVLGRINGLPGTKFTLTILRNEETKDLVVARDLDGKLGAEVTYDQVGLARIITDVSDAGPASRAGLKVGDIVCAVDGKQDFEGDGAERLACKGSLGQPVLISVRRGDTMIEVNLVREAIAYAPLQVLSERSYGGADGGFVHLKVTNLDWIGLPKAIDWEMAPLLTKNAILDLRGAGGNDANITAQVLARFLRYRTPLIGGLNSSLKYEEVYHSTPAVKQYEGKLVVLVDGQTSGTAEALAAALKESGRATILGAKTSGKTFSQVLVQRALPNGDRLSLLLPQMHFTDFQGKPLTAVVPEGKDVVATDDTKHSFHDSLVVSAIESMNASTVETAPLVLLSCALLALAAAGLLTWRSSTRTFRTEEPTSAEDRTTYRLDVHVRTSRYTIALGALAIALVAAAAYAWRTGDDTTGGVAAEGGIVVKVFVDGSNIGTIQAQTALQLQKEYRGSIVFQIVQVEDGQQVVTDGLTQSAPSVEVSKYWFTSDGVIVGRSSNSRLAVTKRRLVELIEQALEPETGKPQIKVERTK